MKMPLMQVWTLVKKSVGAWIDDYAPSMGAAIAYYTVFSIAPLLIIVIAVAGLVFGQDAVRGEISMQLGGLLGAEAAQGVQGIVESASEPVEGIVATLVSVAVLLLGATTVFAELQSALDRIWRVAAPPTASGLWSFLRARLFSFGMVLGLGFLLLVSLAASAGLAALGTWWGAGFTGWEVLLQVINFVVSFALITGVFAMIYKIMPRAPIAWSDVWIGAVVTALLFNIGKLLIGLYIGKSAITSGYGAAGSLVVLLIWVYYSAQIFLLGAEFTWVYASEYGSKVGQSTPAPTPALADDGGQQKDPTPASSATDPSPLRATATNAVPAMAHAPAATRSEGPLARITRHVRAEPLHALKVIVSVALFVSAVARELGGSRRAARRTRLK